MFHRDMASRAKHGAEEHFDRHTNCLMWPEISGGGLSRPRDYELEDKAKAVKSLEERLSHPDLKLLHGLLNSLFKIDPKQRKPAGETLSDPFFADLQ
jgi:hypothetical protein